MTKLILNVSPPVADLPADSSLRRIDLSEEATAVPALAEAVDLIDYFRRVGVIDGYDWEEDGATCPTPVLTGLAVRVVRVSIRLPRYVLERSQYVMGDKDVSPAIMLTQHANIHPLSHLVDTMLRSLLARGIILGGKFIVGGVLYPATLARPTAPLTADVTLAAADPYRRLTARHTVALHCAGGRAIYVVDVPDAAALAVLTAAAAQTHSRLTRALSVEHWDVYDHSQPAGLHGIIAMSTRASSAIQMIAYPALIAALTTST